MNVHKFDCPSVPMSRPGPEFWANSWTDGQILRNCHDQQAENDEG